MFVFYTRSAVHLAPDQRAAYTIKSFSDGELYLKLEQSVKNQSVWVVSATRAPAENMLELFFLLDALTRAGVASINVLVTYFAYARQSVANEGEELSAGFICDTLKRFPIQNTYIIHAHAASQLQTMLPFTNVIDFSFFKDSAAGYDVIAAPDEGAKLFAQRVAHFCNKECVVLQKSRPSHEKVVIESIEGSVEGKRVLLVDDIIATGSTLIAAANHLQFLGAHSIGAAATHGIFSADAHARLSQSIIQAVHVTNTLVQKTAPQIHVFDCAPFVQTIIAHHQT